MRDGNDLSVFNAEEGVFRIDAIAGLCDVRQLLGEVLYEIQVGRLPFRKGEAAFRGIRIQNHLPDLSRGHSGDLADRAQLALDGRRDFRIDFLSCGYSLDVKIVILQDELADVFRKVRPFRVQQRNEIAVCRDASLLEQFPQGGHRRILSDVAKDS